MYNVNEPENLINNEQLKPKQGIEQRRAETMELKCIHPNFKIHFQLNKHP